MMADDNNHSEIKFSKIRTSFQLGKITPPDMSQDIQRKLMDEVSRAFAVSVENLWVAGDKPQPPVSTSVLRGGLLAETTLTKEKLDELINKFLRPKTFEERLRDTILAALKEAGLHPDNLERIAIALNSDIGRQASVKLTLAECSDAEHLAQKFLKIYQDITNQ
jgi:hypothetical protein